MIPFQGGNSRWATTHPNTDCDGRCLVDVHLDKNSLADEMRKSGNERVSVRQGYG
jgi:hypothetical protein